MDNPKEEPTRTITELVKIVMSLDFITDNNNHREKIIEMLWDVLENTQAGEIVSPHPNQVYELTTEYTDHERQTLIDNIMGDINKVDLIKTGAWTIIVCAHKDMPRDEITRKTNLLSLCGTSEGWHYTDEPRDDDIVVCVNDSDKIHIRLYA